MPEAWRVSPYNVADLPSDLDHALAAATLRNETLRKAGAYFRHALFLHQEAWRQVMPLSIHWQLLDSGAVLNYYKAVSLIVGEAGTDHDYRSRYRGLGITQELWKDTERLRKLRDDRDVAHYATGWDRLEKIERSLNFAKTTASRVLTAYAEHLRSRPS